MKRVLINHQIKAKKVRLIDETGKQIGVALLDEALKMARERQLDLIQVTEKLEIPVCKIGDYGKYLYRLQKKERKKGKTEGELKTIRLSFNISAHDIEVKSKQAKKILEKGGKVRIELKLKGREIKFADFGKDKINQFLEILNKLITIKVERNLKREPRGLTTIIAKQ